MGGTRTDDTLSDALQRDFHLADASMASIDIGASAHQVGQSRTPYLYFVLDGAVAIDCGDRPPEHIAAGEWLLLFYGDAHRIVAVGDRRSAALLAWEIELSYVAPAAVSVRAGPPIYAMHHGGRADAALALDTAQIAAACEGPGARAFRLALGNLLLTQTMRAMYRSQWRDGMMEIRSPATRRIAAAMVAMEDHPERNWTVASLARLVGVSRSSFAAGFREAIGASPLAHLREIRLERARRLLEVGGLSVTEVARRSGYPLPSSFARAYARRYGRPPSQG